MGKFAHAAEKRNQLEELLIWKMSDELKLSASEEKKFADIIKELNLKKAVLNRSLQDSIEKMKKISSKDADAELSRYRKALVSYNQLSEEEFDKMKPLLGPERMAQYLNIKQDLTNRIKSMLLNPETIEKTRPKLPQPKLIEEK